MVLFPRSVPHLLLRLATPTGRISAVFKFAVFIVLIHLLSLLVEVILFGSIFYPHHLRFVITACAAAPFVAFALYGFGLARGTRAKLRMLALTDPLTELPNRRALLDALKEARENGRHGLFLLLDADRFKQVNDTLGHDAGDRALLAIAAWMKRHASAESLFARIGGEEFGALLVGPAPERTLEAIRGGLCADLPFDPGLRDRKMTVSLSAGATTFDPARTTEALMKEADQALYLSKMAGGARLTHFGREDAAAETRSPTRSARGLRQAV